MHKYILISRTDGIGDVVLSLPLAGALKILFPASIIFFMGRTYTQAIIETSKYVNEFINFDIFKKLSSNEQIEFLQNKKIDTVIHVFPNLNFAKIAKKAQIATRIGTFHRLHNILYSNKLINLGRKNSTLHEAQLNLKLLTKLGAKSHFELSEIADLYGFEKIEPLLPEFKNLLSPNKFNVILHPKSKGSAREWGLDNFSQLVDLLSINNYTIFITGTKEEGILLKDFLHSKKDKIIDLTGKMSLNQLISFIKQADGLIGASTGTLHIAAALSKIAIGLFAPMRPIFPQRWAPIGKNADFLVKEKKCSDCKKTQNCHCIREITANEIFIKLQLKQSTINLL